MSRGNQHRSITTKCKSVPRKAHRILRNAICKVKDAKLTRMIRRDLGSKRRKWLSNDLAVHTGAAICASAVVSIFTGGLLIEALRAGSSVLFTAVVSDAVNKRRKRKKQNSSISIVHHVARAPSTRRLDDSPLASSREDSESLYQSLDEAVESARRMRFQTVQKKKC